ncbi:hypothetical protein B0T18DRAFT_397130 [Schizothecium vesticola]|uniref:HNH nuclease domain-containing protein n=1 Tax=Schizothecium vesticola TaxID=314040 RepID=A0AA40FA67_9PEZI|nr:hypothetical protein B0T18DRAFT_397130 [Schizothecium vesticola]
MAESEAKLRAIKRRQDKSSDSYDDKKKKVLKPGVILDRDEDAKAERRMLDQNRCVILGTGNPEVCHIVPFSIGSNEEHRRKFRDYLGPGISCIFSETPTWVDGPPDTGLHSIFSEDAGEDDEMEDDLIREDDEMEDDIINEEPPSNLFAIRCRKIFTSKIGVSNKSWNEICLNRQLHNWWGRGFFAFKPLGIDGKFQVTLTSPKGHSITYTQLKLQFHWMPRQNDLLRGISEDVSPQELSSTVGKTYRDLDLTDSLNPVFALDRRSSISHHVQTGDIVYVKVEPRYAERMLAAFRIQWAAIKILAMAGGAESLDDVGDHPDYLDENLNWLGDSGLTIPELFKEWDA